MVESVASLPDKSLEEVDPRNFDIDSNSIPENTCISFPPLTYTDVDSSRARLGGIVSGSGSLVDDVKLFLEYGK